MALLFQPALLAPRFLLLLHFVGATPFVALASLLVVVFLFACCFGSSIVVVIILMITLLVAVVVVFRVLKHLTVHFLNSCRCCSRLLVQHNYVRSVSFLGSCSFFWFPFACCFLFATTTAARTDTDTHIHARTHTLKRTLLECVCVCVFVYSVAFGSMCVRIFLALYRSDNAA